MPKSAAYFNFVDETDGKTVVDCHALVGGDDAESYFLHRFSGEHHQVLVL